MFKTVLALDTSEQHCSIALLHNQQRWFSQQHTPRQHTQVIWPMIQSLLMQGNVDIKALDAIICGNGPGSFTGLRVACSFAQGLAVELDCPIIAVDTLAVLAYGAAQIDQPVIALMDARMQAVYAASYCQSHDGWQVLMSPIELSYDQINQYALRGYIGVGSGFDIKGLDGIRRRLKAVHHTGPITPQALLEYGLHQAQYAQTVDQFKPGYIRNKVAS